MENFAVSVVGRDEPGIVAAISRVLLEHGCNLADATMSVLNGYFAMVLVAQARKGAQANLRERLSEGFVTATRRFELVVSVQPLLNSESSALAQDCVSISIYGTDRPGIVHAATAAIARTDTNVLSLRTQLASENADLYSLFIQAELARGLTPGDLEAVLAGALEDFGVRITVRAADAVEF